MKNIFVSLALILAVSASTISATRAYFTDTATSYNNTFAAGTLNLKVQDSDETFADNVSATWSTPVGWKPGDEVTQSIFLKNTGNVPAEAVYAYWNNLRDTNGLADKIEVTWLSDTTDITTNNIAPFVGVYDANKDGMLSLKELVNGLNVYNSAATPDPYQARFYADSNESYTNPVLKTDGTPFEIKLGYKFMDDAGNAYQGKTATFDFTLTAAQHHYTGGTLIQ